MKNHPSPTITATVPMSISTKTATLSILAALLLGATIAHAGGGHDHGNDGGHEERGDAQGEEPQTLVFTHYTDSTELFLEFPPLIVNQSSRFAAHVTRLQDFQPLTRGTMEVELRRDGKLHAGFRVREPARTGIFTPEVMAKSAGRYQLLVRVRDGDLQATHDLGEVTVTDTDETPVLPPSDDGGDIRYLKEQQWQNPFATTVAEQHPLRSSVPGFATVVAPADGSALVRAPADGYFSAAEPLTTGKVIPRDTLLGYLVPRLGEGTDIGNLLVEVERARSRMALAERDLERMQSLLEQGAVPERRVLEARQTRDVAQVELKTAQSRLQQRSGPTTQAGIALRAPVEGELIAVNVRPGAFVRADEVLFTLVDSQRRWIDIQVPEKFASVLMNASGAWLEPQAPGQSAPVVLDVASGARVVNINSLIDSLTRTATVTLEYPAAIGPRVIGTRLPAHVFHGDAAPTLAVPRSALIDDGGQAVLYVQTGGESFARRTVTLGIQDGVWVEILQGVAPGERVVSEGAYFVKLAAAGGDEIGHGHAH